MAGLWSDGVHQELFRSVCAERVRQKIFTRVFDMLVECTVQYLPSSKVAVVQRHVTICLVYSYLFDDVNPNLNFWIHEDGSGFLCPVFSVIIERSKVKIYFPASLLMLGPIVWFGLYTLWLHQSQYGSCTWSGSLIILHHNIP
ncbi:hypothetical protein FRACYDRAFT_248783 [Fragilariopsis cylindrus CCMP1102]|uniref:Uncharacterized protein n=1 Tax=Fragilariopsis cylindrus CCMP1102 TaxID=635003 RepID=A0A1E7EU03_9STRA|nr:hypothetical protein FRACYDRAFT_248783 [Fragilariopsis cylindrus CCMP1102]|eukprot:OEU09327.1 hypothetical protein FRACYDRAFT_248783 [Fragilariopsis cylindrus CCMP1102]